MPSHPDRVRSAPLPEGYQFGDARGICDYPRASVVGCADGSQITTTPPLAFDADHRHRWVAFDPATLSDLCACGARRARGWNVIEGEHH